jgi:hypothetical protein
MSYLDYEMIENIIYIKFCMITNFFLTQDKCTVSFELHSTGKSTNTSYARDEQFLWIPYRNQQISISLQPILAISQSELYTDPFSQSELYTNLFLKLSAFFAFCSRLTQSLKLPFCAIHKTVVKKHKNNLEEQTINRWELIVYQILEVGMKRIVFKMVVCGNKRNWMWLQYRAVCIANWQLRI